MKKRIASYSVLGLLSLALLGCSHSPTINIAGSFFPSWIICLITGITIAALMHVFLGPRKLDSGIGPLAIFYPAVSLFLACLMWLLLFS
jgi:hypothetical protein